MSKYKVGDKVKVREDLDLGHYGVIDSMLKYKGKKVTIKCVIPHKEYVEYRFEEIGFTWTDDCIVGLAEESKTEFKVGDKVELISVDECDKNHGLEMGDVGIITNIADFSDICKIDFKNIFDRAIYYKQIKLVEEETKDSVSIKTKPTPKPKYVKCITSEFELIHKDEIYEVLSDYGYGYTLKQGDYTKQYFTEVEEPIQSIPSKGIIKYRITDDGITHTTLNGSKTGKSIKSRKDKSSNKIGILIAICRMLNIDENKISDIVDILFNDESNSSAKCDNAVIKNDINRALSILDKYKE